MSNINIDNLADAISKELENYSEGVTEEIKKAVDIVANEVNEEIKNHITFEEPTGKYVKNFKIKSVYNGKFNKIKAWHVAGGQHRLTHLLENGHAKLNGGRTRAYPHIKFGEDIAIKRMEELSREAIDNAGR